MNLKGYIYQTLSIFVAVLSAIALYGYRIAIGHAFAYGIPWHSRYFWPIGPNWWLLPVILLVAVGIFTILWKGFIELPFRVVGPVAMFGLMGTMVVAFGSFRGHYFLLGVIATVSCIANFVGMALGHMD